MPNKTSKADDISIIIIKKTFVVLGKVLLRIINKSIISKEVPDEWKQAYVVPLHKKGSLSSAQNFRPITNVPVICKIVEKIVFEQVDNYLRRNSLYSPDQHGFRPKHSTATALVTISDDMRWAMDRGDVSLLTLIDLSRCFDVVDHQDLLTQLQRLQIDPGWFKSYLSNHQQKVTIPGTSSSSSSRPVNIGVFQGSCLGPLLFNIAAINMASYIPDEVNGLPVRIVRYADDTQVAISGPPSRLVDIQSGVEHVLDALSGYFLQGGWWHVHEPIPRLISCWLVACKHRQPKVQSVCNQPKVSQRTVHGV